MFHRRFFSIAAVVLLLSLPALCRAEPVPVLMDVPETVGVGQPFLLRLSCAAPLAGLSISWNGGTVHPAVTMEEGNPGALVLLGTRLSDEPGEYALEVRALVQGSPYAVQRMLRVAPHEYQHETLSVAPKMVTPPEEVEARIQADRTRMLAAIRTVSAGRHWKLPFSLPVRGKMLSRFGLHRVFNGATKARHKGLDFRAWLGTPIRAIAAGRVVLVIDSYFGGNCVLIDHGEGVVSQSAHLSEVQVQEGQRVACGQVIGLSGATGRVTGAHLHLSVFVQGRNIDPEPLFSLRPAAKSAPVSKSDQNPDPKATTATAL